VKVFIVVPPYESAGPAATSGPAHETEGAGELAEAMRGALAIDVPVLVAPLTSAPTDGYLLAFRVPRSIDPSVARRIIAFDEDRSSVMKNVEQYGFAGAVEKHRYFQWRHQRDRERGYGLIGKKDVAARMSAHLAGPPFTSPDYGIISSDTARDLPGLIAEYLKAYDAAP
jgi:hypothetical protein